jgi:DNA-binding transcriptional MocR family regulator
VFTETSSLIVGAFRADGDGAADDHTARRIASTIGRMITTGSLEVGVRLPTVRELSRRLGVSPTTVSEAWRRLADVGAIETRGRNGTFVRHPTGPGRPRRYRQISEGPGHFALDLSSGTPDPDLLPDLAPIVAKVSRQSLTSSYLDNPVLPALDDELRATWPFPPEALTVVDGAMDALDRVASVVLHLGDRVVVEHPGFPPMLDLLERLSCDVVGVDVDDEGLDVEQLRAALDDGPATAVILQPRAQNPAGVAMSPGRARAIAEVLRPTATLTVEDDHSNEISSAELTSVGAWLPDRTVHIRSFSKSHGPDLRLAAVGGAGDVVTAVENRRLLGPGWSSRILQSVLLELIRHPATAATLADARAAYADRRRAVCEVLVDHGVDVTGTDGINLWVGVDDERAAVVALATHGIGVAPGTPFLVRPDADHLRVTVGMLSPERGLTEVADKLAGAAHLASSRRRRSTAAAHR